MFNIFRLSLLGFLCVFFVGCSDSGSDKDPVGQEPISAAPTPDLGPTMESIKFGEMRGRAGHQGVFPLQGEPTAGPVYLMVETKGDVITLAVDVQSDINSTRYTSTSPSATYDDTPTDPLDDLKAWDIEATLPSGSFSLHFTLTTSDGKELLEVVKNKTTKDVKIQLARSDFEFTYGSNAVQVAISNYGDDADFTVIATDNYGFSQAQFDSVELLIKKGKTVYIDIPMDLEPSQITSDIYDYEIAVQVNASGDQRSNTAKMAINITKSPTVIKNIDKLIVINPGSCTSVSASSPTVQAVIAGSSKIILDAVDLNSIVWMNGEVTPITSEISDVVSFDNHVCDDVKPDGKNDLVMSFALQDILSYDRNRDYKFSWPAYIGYGEIDETGGAVFRFSMGVTE